jgi:diguanylate cyclase (GGDEF)-like protein
MTPELERRLKLLIDFPSPAGVAAQVVNVANDPDADLGRIAQVISLDPAISAKMLRTANSPFYGQRRKSQNLRQAIMVLGLNATITLALGFSLVKTFEQRSSAGIDYPRFWRRALLSAIAARAFAEVKKLPSNEEMFLAALLQDIGVLALDRHQDSFYRDLPQGASHDETVAYERERLGCDHADVGAWLLRSWHVPSLLCDAVDASHRALSIQVATDLDAFMQSVALSGIFAEGLIRDEGAAPSRTVSEAERELLQIDEPTLVEIVERIKAQIPEMESLFEQDIMAAWEFEGLMGRAREVLLMRSLDTLREFQRLSDAHTLLASRTEELRRASLLDALTGAYNRRYFDEKLAEEVHHARACNWPLSLMFADLDHFKRVNDQYGHQAGDEVLRGAARLLTQSLRETDLVARYGGEEFVVILPGTNAPEAMGVAARVSEAFRKHVHTVGPHEIKVTVSIGVVTDDTRHSAGADDLVRAADLAVYAAKGEGRDRVVEFDKRLMEPDQAESS